MENSSGVTQTPQDKGHNPQPKRRVLICQNTACSKSGALAVLKTFQALELPEVELVASGCLGQCGNGPMVLILPEQIWYRYVRRQNVRTIAAQHLRQGNPDALIPSMKVLQESDTALLKNGGDRSQLWAYVFLLLALLIGFSMIAWALA